MELPDDIYARVVALSDEGNDFFDADQPTEAMAKWQAALALLPQPRTNWEAATWLYASIGDACLQMNQPQDARDALLDALNCPDGMANPFIHFRLGQATARLSGMDAAVEHFLKAYMLDGEDIFHADPDGAEPLDALRQRGLIE